MKLGINKSLLGLALALASTAAIASVTFDASNGTGFVGKGDVQMPFGYNNAVMQSHHTHIAFTYLEMEVKTQECYSHERGVFTLEGHRTKSQGVSARLLSDSRKTGQWTGWFLNGWNGDPIETDTGWTTTDGTPAPNGCPVGSTPRGGVVVIQSGQGLYAVDFDNAVEPRQLIWTQAP